MVCTTLTVSAVGDKYYDCVNGKCVEKAGGQYKNDPTCAGKCGTDIVAVVLLAAAAVAAMFLLGGRNNE